MIHRQMLRARLWCFAFSLIFNTAANAQTSSVFDVSRVPPESGYVLMRGDRIDVLFPRISFEPLDCGSKIRRAGAARMFQWGIGWRHVDTTHAQQQGAAMVFEVRVPVNAPEFEAVDSALSKVSLYMARENGHWEPTGWLEQDYFPNGHVLLFEPERRAIYFDGGRLHIAMTGIQFRDSLLTGSRDTLMLRRCNGGPYADSLMVPVVRR